MSEQQHSGFGQFIPGFDFLQNLAKGASASLPQMPNLSSWIAPTLNVEELDKRIGELKAVQFWLEQNKTALAATIQALELQKMTLATLKGMNFNMADVADAMKVKPAASAAAADAAPQNPKGTRRAEPKARQANGGPAGADAKIVDPLQWWGALTQQFQQIAANAMQEVATSADGDKRANAAAGAKPAPAPAPGQRSRSGANRKRPARKAAAG
ncbi:MAG TPA: PhaM family polyhydroxyalkanoate granule multifunctional regulatory protein [Ramlibacter sp.]|nr:PhaM family polyhydroxyalkanoate granule multifunctional regulatory protein [Ramlibacter sp.]